MIIGVVRIRIVLDCFGVLAGLLLGLLLELLLHCDKTAYRDREPRVLSPSRGLFELVRSRKQYVQMPSAP